MRKTGVAEWVLERVAGGKAGAAIYGDLLEVAATRGRLWFFAAYIRTLLFLAWRPLTAFFAGAILYAFLNDRLVFPAMWFFAMSHPYLGELIGDVTLALFFGNYILESIGGNN